MAKGRSRAIAKAQKKRQVSAQQRVHLSQVARMRQRAPKGSPLGGSFLAGAGSAFGGHLARHTINQNPLAKEGRAERASSGTKHGTSGSYVRETMEGARERWARGVRQNPERYAERGAYYEAANIVGDFDPATGRARLPREQTQRAPVNVRSGVQKELQARDQQLHWDRPGVFATETPKPFGEFIGSAPDPMKEEIDKLMSDPSSPFNKGVPPRDPSTYRGKYNPTARRRGEQYARHRQAGLSHSDALQRVAEARQGPTGRRAGLGPTGLDTKSRRPGRRKPVGRRTKYEPAVTRPDERSIGVSQEMWEKASDISQRYPDFSEKQTIRMQEAQKVTLFDESLRNAKWQQETKRSQILGDKAGQTQSPDRVTVFTTNLGGPSVSVPSDSLVGQYIILKRKSMMRNARVPNAQLRGEFPAAVRDMHLFELSTGLHYGLEGAHGAYHRMGWRSPKKTSKNFGKPVPVGSQIMYDSQGSPVYDAQGNIRFTQGATRRFRYETPDVGFRIFIG